MPQPDSIQNLELDREENSDYFNLIDIFSGLEKEYRRLQRQIEDAPHQVSVGQKPRLVRRRLRVDWRRLEQETENWGRDLRVFLARPYLAVSGADKERTFSQALARLTDHSRRLAAHRDRLAQGLDDLKKLKRPPPNHFLGKVAIFMAPIVLVLVLMYLYRGGYFNLSWLPGQPGDGPPAAAAPPAEVAPAAQPGALPEPAPEESADSLDTR